MASKTCLHPYCDKYLTRGRYCCPRHWHHLPDELQSELKLGHSTTEMAQLEAEITDYFEDRMIGPHEIEPCWNKCGADIVAMVSSRGTKVPVDPDTVAPEDMQFSADKHDRHSPNCPEFENRRRP